MFINMDVNYLLWRLYPILYFDKYELIDKSKIERYLNLNEIINKKILIMYIYTMIVNYCKYCLVDLNKKVLRSLKYFN